jgi:hypothetical protein
MYGILSIPNTQIFRRLNGAPKIWVVDHGQPPVLYDADIIVDFWRIIGEIYTSRAHGGLFQYREALGFQGWRFSVIFCSLLDEKETKE